MKKWEKASPVEELAGFLRRYPGIGTRMAYRIIWELLQKGESEIRTLISLLEQLADMRTCEICFHVDVRSPCRICTDPSRDSRVLCIVPTFREVFLMENTGAFRGKYHVLGGLVDPLEDVMPEQLHVNSLLKRIAQERENLQELFFAFPPTPEAEITFRYILRQIPPDLRKRLRITGFARGVGSISSLDTTDIFTLSQAIQYRIPLREDENETPTG